MARAQRDFLLVQGQQLSGAQKISGEQNVQLMLDAQRLRATRLLNGELKQQAEIAAGIRDAGGRIIGPKKPDSFQDVVNSYTTAQGLQQRTVSLFAGQIGTLMAYGAVVAGTTAFVKGLVGGQADVQEQTSRLAIVMNDAAGRQRADLLLLTDGAKEWSASHGQMTRVILEAEYALGAAGLRTRQVLETIPAAALLSQGGLLDLAESTETLAVATQTYGRSGLTAIEAANDIQATAASTLVTVRDLGTALKYVTGTAETAGLSFTELNALVGALGQLGLRGSIAGTSLNQFLTQLIAKRGQLKQLGVEIEDVNGRLKPAVELLAELRKAFGTQISTGESKLLQQLFDIRGGRAAQRLIPDTQYYLRTLEEVQAAEVEVFRAAEAGSNNLKESWKVFGNSLQNVLLGSGNTAAALQLKLDYLTNRSGKRAASDIGAGAAGVAYQIGTLDRLMEKNQVAARGWAMALLETDAAIAGKLGPDIAELAGRMPAMNALSKGWMSMDRVQELRYYLAVLHNVKAEAEDFVKGGNIVQNVLGVAPVGSIGADAANNLLKSSLDVQKNFAEQQAALAERRLSTFKKFTLDTVSAEVSGLTQLAAEWRAKAKGLEGDADAAKKFAALQLSKEAGKAQLDVLRAQSSLLGTVAGGLDKQDYGSRLAFLERDVQLKKAILAKELAVFVRAKDDEIAQNADGETEIRTQIVAQREATALKLKQVDAQAMIDRRALMLEEYNTRADQAKRIMELQQKISLVGKSGLEKTNAERMFAMLDFQMEVSRIYGESMLTGLPITARRMRDRLGAALGQFTLSGAQTMDAGRQRNVQLARFEQELVVAQARGLADRSRGLDKFNQERVVAEAQFILDYNRAADEHKGDIDAQLSAQLLAFESWQARERDVQREQNAWIKQNALDAVQGVGDGLSGISALIEATSNRARAKFVADMASTANAAVNVLETVSKLKGADTLGQVGGVFSIVGTLSSLAASLFGRRAEDQRTAAALRDEFVHSSGKTVSTDFGRAQVFNIRVEQNIGMDFLTAPNRKQVYEAAEAMAPALVEVLADYGIGTAKR